MNIKVKPKIHNSESIVVTSFRILREMPFVTINEGAIVGYIWMQMMCVVLFPAWNLFSRLKSLVYKRSISKFISTFTKEKLAHLLSLCFCFFSWIGQYLFCHNCRISTCCLIKINKKSLNIYGLTKCTRFSVIEFLIEFQNNWSLNKF